MSALSRPNSDSHVPNALFLFRTAEKHANYLPSGSVLYEVYCFLVNILGKEYYSTVSLWPTYAWDILFVQVC